MKKSLTIIAVFLIMANYLQAQLEPAAGNWKTWFIKSGRDYRLPAPSSYKNEIAQVLSLQQNIDAAGLQQIIYRSYPATGNRVRLYSNK